MRKKNDSLRGTLIECARQIANSDGINSINIRLIAEKVGVATGTVYNYFTSKEEILLALTEEFWNETIIEMNSILTVNSFDQQLEKIFYFLKDRIECSAGQLMSSLGSSEVAGQQRMSAIQASMETIFIRCLKQDQNICKSLWNETFSIDLYAHFIMMNMMTLLRAKSTNPQFLIEVVKRTIY